MKRKMWLIFGIISMLNGTIAMAEEQDSAQLDKVLFRQNVECDELNLNYYFEYEYDEKGSQIARREYSESGSLQATIEYIYNEDGNVEQEIEYDSRNNVKRKTDCEYDSNGNITKEIINDDGEVAERVYKYNSMGRLSSKSYTGSDGQEKKWIYIYEGDKIVQVDYVNNGKLEVDKYYKYDTNGYLISTIGPDRSGNEYEYDENGLKIKDTMVINGDPYIVSTFEYKNLFEEDTIVEEDIEKEIDNREIIKLVQDTLNKMGYDCGTPDGIAGQKTETAILAYQKETGLNESGVVDVALLKALDIAYLEIESKNEMESEANNIIVDETEWESWKSTKGCMLFLFMEASEMIDFSWGNPERDGDHVWVDCFDSNGDFAMYYAVDGQKVIYVGLYTDNTNVFTSESFRNACVKLMRSYNISYDNGSAVLNLTEERAGQIVDYAMNQAEHCLADNMRIQVVRDDGYYSFHIEY